jgi:hypothetical protein
MYYVTEVVYSQSPSSQALHFFNTITVTHLLKTRCWLCSIWESEITYSGDVKFMY